MNSPRKPSVLFVFYTHTEQSRRVADAMASVLRERGCDVWMAGIEFTDPRYAGKFDRFPFRHAVLDLLAVLPAQVRRSTGRSASLTRRGRVTTTWSVSARRRGSSPPTCRCARI
jgi:hypothetical protein